MPIFAQPLGKGGVGVGTKLGVAVVSYEDSILFNTGAYNFGFGGGNRDHAVYVSQPLTPATGADPLRFLIPLTEGVTAGEYSLAAFGGTIFDSVQAIDQSSGGAGTLPPTTVFNNVATGPVLRIEPSVFGTEHAFYLVAVVQNLNAPAGPLAPGNIIDFQMIFLQKEVLDIYSAVFAGVDETMLGQALFLAGHNLKVPQTTYIEGLPATRQIHGFDPSLTPTTTPTLETPTDTVGRDLTLGQDETVTPDASKNIQQTQTGDSV